MGYIVPVNSYQYMDYHNREIGIKNDPFTNLPIGKIRAIKQGESSTLSHFSEQNLPKNPHQDFQNHPKKRAASKVEQVYSEVTGKGMLFNDYI
jgi:hypothetical protein